MQENETVIRCQVLTMADKILGIIRLVLSNKWTLQQIIEENKEKDPVQQQIKAIDKLKDTIVEFKEVMPKFQNSFDAFFTGLKDNMFMKYFAHYSYTKIYFLPMFWLIQFFLFGMISSQASFQMFAIMT